MPVEHSPVRGTRDARECGVSSPAPPASVPPDAQTTSTESSFIPPAARLAAVTRKGNEIIQLMNSQSKDKAQIQNLYQEYQQRIDNLMKECESQVLNEENSKVRSEWVARHHSHIINIRVSIEKYLQVNKGFKGTDSRGTRSIACSRSSAESATSTTRARLAERKAKLEAERAFSEKVARLQNELRKAELDKQAMEHDLLERELNKLEGVEENVHQNLPGCNVEPDDGEPVTLDLIAGGGHQASTRDHEANFNKDSSNRQQTPANDFRPSNLNRDTSGRQPRAANNHENTLMEILRQQNEITLNMTRQQSRSELPKKELVHFDGSDITRFQSFMRSFMCNIHNKCETAVDKLYYLEQFTAGAAQEIVRSCNNSDANKAYRQALQLLEEEYGNEHKTAAAYLEKLENWPPIKNEDGEKLKELSTYLLTCCNSMDNMTALNQLNNPKEIMSIVMKLPFELRKKWRSKTQQLTENYYHITFNTLVEFIRAEARTINQPIFGSIKDTTKTTLGSFNKRKILKTEISPESVTEREDKLATHNDLLKYCYFCKKSNHELPSCHFFKSKVYEEKVEFIKTKRLCFGCLREGHTSRGCTRRMTCNVCQKKHPTLLHFERKERKEGNKYESQQTEEATACASKGPPSSYIGDGNNKIACAVIPLKLKLSGSNIVITTYASLDTCSNACFLDERILKRLNVKGINTKLQLSTMEGTSSHSHTKVINNLELYDLDDNLQDVIPVVYAQKKWPFSSEDSPTADVAKLEHLADVPFNFIDADITLIIGMNRPEMVKPLQIVDGAWNEAYASLHRLGWALNGPVSGSQRKVTSNKIHAKDLETLENQIKAIYDTDYRDSHLQTKEMSVEDQKWKTIMDNTMTLTPLKHYEVDLPLKENIDLKCNRTQVFFSFLALLRRFQSNEKLFQDYQQFMTMMLDNGHIEKVPPDQVNSKNAWYLMHHAVYHKQKQTIRIVFNCSLKHKGVSLNDVLYQGPDLANSLLGVLLRFRQYEIAAMGDIVKMFFQVGVSTKCRDYLRFYWIDGLDSGSTPCEYRFKVHLFGATSSPSVANYALQRTAIDNDGYSSEAKALVLHSFYVDDLLASFQSEETAINLVEEVANLVANGGFTLTKFVSNSKTLQSRLAADSEPQTANKQITAAKGDRALGLLWNTKADTLKLQINTDNKPITKRGILSAIHGVFDPLGICGPGMVTAKKLFQDSCKLKIEWDTPLPNPIREHWIKWYSELTELERFELPRCCQPFSSSRIELHCFADGSETAYGAVAYARFEFENGNNHCALLFSKSRLNPLSNSTYRTIPRVELNGAKLAVVIKQILLTELTFPVDEVYYWTDSLTVLNYIKNEEKRFDTFITNRVRFIRSHSNATQWRYVPSSQNPADCLSRGVTINKLLSLRIWKHGPAFLMNPEHTWPGQPETSVNEQQENTIMCAATETTDNQSNDAIDKLLTSTNDWFKVKCRVAWMLRFKSYLINKTKGERRLKLEEVNNAETAILRYLQRKHFTDTFAALAEGKALPRNNPLRKLDPYIDEYKLLRVGGRLQNSALSHHAKHPIILPRRSYVITILVAHTHSLLGHMGRATMSAYLKSKYWIIGMNSVIRKVLYNCVSCRKLNAQPLEQKMATLPVDRVTADEPAFTRTGLDFFGPFNVVNGRKREKRYGVVFTCLSSRAVHLEMSHSLSTDSFIQAFRRFVSRRGNVRCVRSDNGTNIVAGNKELKEALAEWNDHAVYSWMLQNSIEWKFQPPAASHFGGAVEREIRTVRKILNSILNEQLLRLSDEHLNTVLCEVEAIMNCRPLTELSDSIDDLEALTPNHLLLLHGGATFPPGLFTKENSYLTRRWRQVQYLADLFWCRWRREYVVLLQKRQKWFKNSRTYKIGDLVLLTDQLLPRNQWSLGRIIAIYPDKDNNVRVVRVKVAKYKNAKYDKLSFGVTELDRPITKLILIKPTEE